MRQRIALVMLFGLLAALGFLLFGVESTLPERIATHFGADGIPDGWGSREGFTRSIAAVVLLPVAIVQGVGFLLGKFPPSFINLPNRDYWLAPERRARTLDHIRTVMLEFGNALFAFLLFVAWSIIDANHSADARLGRLFPYGLLAFLAFVAVWSFALIRGYSRVPEAPAAPGSGLRA